jgi:hypothetical protein
VAFKLVAFDSCEDTLAGLKKAVAPLVGEYGLPDGIPYPDVFVAREGVKGPVPAQAPGAAADMRADGMAGAPGAAAEQDHSTTNTHEAGVDEPDLVKTDGRRLITIAEGRLRVVDMNSKRLTGTLNLPDGAAATGLLLHGDRALVLTTGYETVPPPRFGKPAVPRPYRPWGGASAARILLVDLAGEPKVLSSLSVDGTHVDARQVGTQARIVVRSAPHLPFVYPDDRRTPAAAKLANQRILARSSVDEWLPRYELKQGSDVRKGRLVDCDQVRHPKRYLGTTMLTVLTIDLGSAGATLGSGDAVSIVANGDTVYGTGGSLYVADREYGDPIPLDATPGSVVVSPKPRTEIHKFDISAPGRPRYVASGEVGGELLNQYSLSEHDGYLRVATTTPDRGECCWPQGPPGPNERSEPSQSAVTVLAQRGGDLVQVGKVDGLGKGERIYAVRFLGPVGYVVTFRQTDPLYTLDLSEPRRPRVAGELKITGYSAYLHPAGDGRLIGVGQDATGKGRVTGTQVSLFDVADPAEPRRLAQYQLRYGSSEVESDPHAFLYWPATGLVVLPVTGAWGWDGAVDVEPGAEPGIEPGVPTPKTIPPRPQNGALVLRLTDGALTEVGMVRHPLASRSHRQLPGGDVWGYPDNTVRRALIAGDTLWTVSSAGVLATDQRSLARQAWVPFT